MTNVPVLRLVSLFASLNDDELAELAPLFMQQAIDKGDFVFFEGDPPLWVYIVIEGRIKLLKHSVDGKQVILHLLQPGEMFGGVAAFGRRPYPFTAQALIPSGVLKISGPDFHKIMEQHPEVSNQVVRELAARLIEAHEAMKNLAIEHVEQRIAHTILKLASHSNGDEPNHMTIDIRLTRQDIADMSGTTVETTIRVFSKWRQAGIVESQNGKIVIHDRERLEAICFQED
ncbi:MAG: Crp/Fnr family transcriptional regulator, partial [Anaerolineae bacterium]